MRVMVELRRDANPETVLAELQRRTALQSNYGAILLALVHGKPIQLTLRQLLQEFLEYRELTLIRRLISPPIPSERRQNPAAQPDTQRTYVAFMNI